MSSLIRPLGLSFSLLALTLRCLSSSCCTSLHISPLGAPWELKKRASCNRRQCRRTESCCLSVSPVHLSQKAASDSAAFHTSLSAPAHTQRKHTHTYTIGVLQSNLSIIQLHSAQIAPSRNCLFAFCRRIIRPLLFCGSLSGDERTIKHYCCRHHSRSIPGPQSAVPFFFRFCKWCGAPLSGVIVCVSACLVVVYVGGCGQLVKQALPVPCSDFNCTVKSDLAL